MNLKKVFKITQAPSNVAFLFIITFCILAGCKKEDAPTELYYTDLQFCEEAFPGVQGEVVEIIYQGHMISCELINGMYIYQGDILVDYNQDKSLKGIGIDLVGNKWKNYIIPYKINEDLKDRPEILDAIEYFNMKTNIQFVKRSNETDYIEFIWDEYGCSSYFGMIGGKQEVRIADWAKYGNIIHEIGHAIGLLHEHCKENRDEYLEIILNNVPNFKKHNFKVSGYSFNTEGFDFRSIMLYSPKAFTTKKDIATMTKADGSMFVSQRDILSWTDVQTVNTLYPK